MRAGYSFSESVRHLRFFVFFVVKFHSFNIGRTRVTIQVRSIYVRYLASGILRHQSVCMPSPCKSAPLIANYGENIPFVVRIYDIVRYLSCAANVSRCISVLAPSATLLYLCQIPRCFTLCPIYFIFHNLNLPLK